jgi:hypothetical protein
VKPVVSMMRWRDVVLNRHLWGPSRRSEALRFRLDARRTRCIAADIILLERDYIDAVIELICYCMTFVDETLCSRLG